MNLTKKDSVLSQGFYLADLISYGSNILASGMNFPSGSMYGNNQVVLMDTAFNVLSRFNLDSVTSVNPGCAQNVGISNVISNLYNVGQNKYAVTGFYGVMNTSSCQSNYQTVFAEIQNNTTVLNSKIIGVPFQDNLITSGGPSSGSKRYGYIYTAGIVGYNMMSPGPPQSTPTKILLHKVDTLGNIKWMKTFKDTNIYYNPYGVYATADSGVVICGLRYDLAAPSVPNVCQGFIMKIDKDGNQLFLGLQEQLGNGVVTHKCYPNPTQNTLYFEFPGDDVYTVSFYDSSGDTVINCEYISNSPMDVSKLPPSVYTYSAIGKTIRYYGKIVKLP